MYLRLSEASAMYQQGKTGLWKPPDLQLAINWREQRKPTLPGPNDIILLLKEQWFTLEPAKRNIIEEEANKLRLQKKRIRRIRIIASGLGISCTPCLGYMMMTIERQIEADKLAKNAEIRMMQAVREKEKADSSLNCCHCTKRDSRFKCKD